MRILKFSKPNDEKIYKMLYEGLAMSERPMKAGDLRLCAKLFDKFETIGKFSEERFGRRFFLLEQTGNVELEEPEYNLLKEIFDQVTWNTIGAREAAPVQEWLYGIKEESIKPKLV